MDTTNNIECAICLESIDIDSKEITVCNHIFHKDCLAQIRSNACPLCRQVLYTNWNHDFENELPIRQETLQFREELLQIEIEIIQSQQEALDTYEEIIRKYAEALAPPRLIASNHILQQFQIIRTKINQNLSDSRDVTNHIEQLRRGNHIPNDIIPSLQTRKTDIQNDMATYQHMCTQLYNLIESAH